MTRAYQEIYLNKAQSVLGDAFDYVINTCGIAGNDFIKLFSASTVSGRMENGEPDVYKRQLQNSFCIPYYKHHKEQLQLSVLGACSFSLGLRCKNYHLP